MRAIVSVPYYDTAENGRAIYTAVTINYLRNQLDSRHTIIAVDNGSTDKSAADWFPQGIVHNMLPKATSIAGGVNAGWHIYEEELMAGGAIAVKHDSDLVCEGDWLDALISVFESDPDVYIAGPQNSLHAGNIADWCKADHGSWFETPFVYGGIQARSPACFQAIGYARQPYGYWGYADHWDTWRVKYLGRKLAMLSKYEFIQLHTAGARSQEYKVRVADLAATALRELEMAVEAGERPIYEEYTA